MTFRSSMALAGVIALTARALLACGGGGASGPPLMPDPVAEVDGGAEEREDAAASAPTAEVTSLPPLPAAEPAPVASADASAPAPPSGSEEDARALLQQFVAAGADHAALTRSLRPQSKDFKALFDPGAAKKVEAAQTKDWDSNKAVIKPKPAQTEVRLWSATGAELAKGTGNAKEFPGGYKKVGKHLSPSAVYYRFKFVEPGKDVGTAYDGLAYVNGHWVIVPKPWRAIEGNAGSDDDDATTTRPEKAPKKKPRGKKK